jgi:SAM-dependent methyltransferase
VSGNDVEAQWRDAAAWWIDDGSVDPVYAETILPLLRRLLDLDGIDAPVLDLGCGEGSVADAVGADRVVGVDVTTDLLEVALGVMPVVRARLPHLDWVRPGSLGGAYSVLVIEHLADLDAFFASVAHVVQPGGRLIVVSNHPAYTAPGAGPLIDTSDGEVLWRWGPYFSIGTTEEPAGDGVMTFHHRPLATILTTAARFGWSLDELVESPLGEALASDPGFAGQDHLPRLFAARWTLQGSESTVKHSTVDADTSGNTQREDGLT